MPNNKADKKIENKTMVVLDAHAIIHRAYHALPAFTNSEGEPTGALYGVTTMTLKIIETFNPDYIVAAFDLPKPTFRHQAYDAYKAGRTKTEDALVSQLQTARGLFESFGIPVLDAEGFEADDIIGTLTEKFKNLNIIIASGDMDTMQLIDGERVKVFTLKKGLNDTILYDEKAVLERFGFNPEQLVDYKGLRGDPSDNIIGVPGIGEKTATTIIEKFGSIEGLYNAIEKDKEFVIKQGISSRIVSLLIEHKEEAFFSKTLATIRRDAPIEFILPEKKYIENVDPKAIFEVLQKYEFRSLSHKINKIFSIKEEFVKEENIDQDLLEKASIALWVLYSENTTPDYEIILQKTKSKNLPDAWEKIQEELRKRNLLDVFSKIEEPLIPIIKKMESRGIKTDKKHFEKMKELITNRLKEIEIAVEKSCGISINLNSPKQLSSLLFDTLGLKPKGKKKDSGAYTTNAETLESLKEDHEIIPLILEHREIQKILSSYVESILSHMDKEGKIHAKFFQHGTTTGRFSSSDPNMQTLPTSDSWGKEVKKGFVVSKEHVFISCDYSQIELRVLAMLSGDKNLLESFERGEDIHTSVASLVFGVDKASVTALMRRNAKVINFGIIYGMGVSALQKNLGTTKAEAQKFYDEYFAAFPTIRKYLEDTKDFAKEHGYTQTAFGRRRYFPTINSNAPFLRAIAERTATNAPIQGTAADIIKLAIIDIEKSLNQKSLSDKIHLVLQVHDELVYEVHESKVEEAKELIMKTMISVIKNSPISLEITSVPLTVSFAKGYSLAELK